MPSNRMKLVLEHCHATCTARACHLWVHMVTAWNVRVVIEVPISSAIKACIRDDSRVDKPGASRHADVAGPVVPTGIGGVEYVLAAVDGWSRFLWALPMKKKSQTSRLLALLVQRINTQVRKPCETGV